MHTQHHKVFSRAQLRDKEICAERYSPCSTLPVHKNCTRKALQRCVVRIALHCGCRLHCVVSLTHGLQTH